jgi:hypothetical protein
MSTDLNQVMHDLGADAEKIAVNAFRQSLRNTSELAKQLCPVGSYGRRRGRAAKDGGDLRKSLIIEFDARVAGHVVGRCYSGLAYAQVQHDEAFHHPGLYTRGSAGPKYAAKYFERAVEMVFGSLTDPLGKFSGQLPASFKELLKG